MAASCRRSGSFCWFLLKWPDHDLLVAALWQLEHLTLLSLRVRWFYPIEILVVFLSSTSPSSAGGGGTPGKKTLKKTWPWWMYWRMYKCILMYDNWSMHKYYNYVEYTSYIQNILEYTSYLWCVTGIAIPWATATHVYKMMNWYTPLKLLKLATELLAT